MNAVIAEPAGTRLSKILNMVNTKMFEFKHPKYYTELRKRNKSDQVISESTHDGESERAPDPGQSAKLQAPSVKFRESQASSDKRQAPSSKRQA